MIEAALCKHLKSQRLLSPFLTTYAGEPAVFSQEAPADVDILWGEGPQYGRIVFTEDLQGDPERTIGGQLVVDILCQKHEDDPESNQYPEDVEPIVRELIDGWFFCNGTFTVAAQWKNSSYFTQPTDHVTGCTVSFDLLAFPVLTTSDPDVVKRINEWTRDTFPQLHVINCEALSQTAWKPNGKDAAIYWRLVSEGEAGWIPDTISTIWRTATLKGHVFADSNAVAADVSKAITHTLYAVKRLKKDGEAPIMVNRRNRMDLSADPLRTGQVSVEGTYGVVVRFGTDKVIENIRY